MFLYAGAESIARNICPDGLEEFGGYPLPPIFLRKVSKTWDLIPDFQLCGAHEKVLSGTDGGVSGDRICQAGNFLLA